MGSRLKESVLAIGSPATQEPINGLICARVRSVYLGTSGIGNIFTLATTYFECFMADNFRLKSSTKSFRARYFKENFYLGRILK